MIRGGIPAERGHPLPGLGVGLPPFGEHLVDGMAAALADAPQGRAVSNVSEGPEGQKGQFRKFLGRGLTKWRNCGREARSREATEPIKQDVVPPYAFYAGTDVLQPGMSED